MGPTEEIIVPVSVLGVEHSLVEKRRLAEEVADWLSHLSVNELARVVASLPADEIFALGQRAQSMLAGTFLRSWR